jgi:hypothetical protein
MNQHCDSSKTLVALKQHLQNKSNVISLHAMKGNPIPAAERDRVHTHSVSLKDFDIMSAVGLY